MIELYQGDCLEFIKKMNDNKVDLVVIDPPYGINYKSEWSDSFDIIKNDDNTIQLTSNGNPIGDKVDLCSCGIKSFDVDENDNITITLINGKVIELGNIPGASGATFTPHISEDKILTWTCDKDLPVPDPVDLNPFDEWEDDSEISSSDYVWEEE